MTSALVRFSEPLEQLAGPRGRSGPVDWRGFTVKDRRGDRVVALVAIEVNDEAGDTGDVAETLGVAVVRQPRATVVTGGDGALQRLLLLDLAGGNLDDLGVRLAVAPLRRNAGVGLAAVRVGTE